MEVSTHLSNPYSGQTFLTFFVVLLQRIWLWLSGGLSFNELSSDEVQMLVLVGIAASTALVGCFLVLRKMTMLANSLSHTILAGIVIAYLITQHTLGNGEYTHAVNVNAMLIASVLTGLITAFLTEFLTKTVKLQEDASTGLVFTSLFAIGIILVTIASRNAHIGIEVVMGNVDALHRDDSILAYLILGINVFLIVIFFKEYKITTFDPYLAKAVGISPLFFNYLLMTQVSATAIGAFRAVGVLLVLAFITGPVLTAKLLTHNLKTLILLSIGIGCMASIIGVALSRHFLTVWEMPLSTGGLVVCVLSLIYVTTIFYKRSCMFFYHRGTEIQREA